MGHFRGNEGKPNAKAEPELGVRVGGVTGELCVELAAAERGVCEADDDVVEPTSFQDTQVTTSKRNIRYPRVPPQWAVGL